MKKEFICTVCPMGCNVTVEAENGKIISVTGNTCKRGESYAIGEFTDPRRILTSSVRIEGSERAMLPVRSSAPLPKDLVLECMKEIKAVSVTAPIAEHAVIIENILDTGINIISSMDMEAK